MGIGQLPGHGRRAALREAFTAWLQRRYGWSWTRHAGAARQRLARGTVRLCPDRDRPHPPGASPWWSPQPVLSNLRRRGLLAGATPYYAPSDPARNFAQDWDSVPDDVWARTQLLFVCSPGNPTGAVMPLSEWQKLFELSDRHGFVIASDECYSEIYFRDEPPLGGLEAAAQLGRTISRT
jgi:N-succinyldiaminopimelate aminotransferase